MSKETEKLRYQKHSTAYKELKSRTPCYDCGSLFPYFLVDYDHVPERGKKLRNVATMAARSLTSPTLVQELEKCDLVCKNCHGMRTHRRHCSDIECVCQSTALSARAHAGLLSKLEEVQRTPE